MTNRSEPYPPHPLAPPTSRQGSLASQVVLALVSLLAGALLLGAIVSVGAWIIDAPDCWENDGSGDRIAYAYDRPGCDG